MPRKTVHDSVGCGFCPRVAVTFRYVEVPSIDPSHLPVDPLSSQFSNKRALTCRRSPLSHPQTTHVFTRATSPFSDNNCSRGWTRPGPIIRIFSLLHPAALDWISFLTSLLKRYRFYPEHEYTRFEIPYNAHWSLYVPL